MVGEKGGEIWENGLFVRGKLSFGVLQTGFVWLLIRETLFVCVLITCWGNSEFCWDYPASKSGPMKKIMVVY